MENTPNYRWRTPPTIDGEHPQLSMENTPNYRCVVHRRTWLTAFFDVPAHFNVTCMKLFSVCSNKLNSVQQDNAWNNRSLSNAFTTRSYDCRGCRWMNVVSKILLSYQKYNKNFISTPGDKLDMRNKNYVRYALLFTFKHSPCSINTCASWSCAFRNSAMWFSSWLFIYFSRLDIFSRVRRISLCSLSSCPCITTNRLFKRVFDGFNGSPQCLCRFFFTTVPSPQFAEPAGFAVQQTSRQYPWRDLISFMQSRALLLF